MRELVAFGLAAVVAAASWSFLAGTFNQPVFVRRNHRGADVPGGAGVIIALVTVALDAGFGLADVIRHHDTVTARTVTLLVVAGFALLGLVDDVAAAGDDRGYRGHLRALASGRLTTGATKLIGGGLLALAVGATLAQDVGHAVVAALVIALGANLGNLLDRAPGRTIKAGVLAAIPIFVLASAAERHQLSGVAMVIGAAAGLLPFDLREDLMLGDAGSNVIGAALGLAVVLSTGFTVWLATAAVLAVLNVASELVSFSRVIDAVGPLKFMDRLGRKRAG